MEQRQTNQFSDSSLTIENYLQKGSNELLNQTKNYNTLDKKISRIQSLNLKNEKEYQMIIYGILNGMLFDENTNIDNYFQILFSINNDSFKSFLKILVDVLEFSKIKKDKYEKIYQIFEKLNKINVDNQNLIEILIYISRNFYPGQDLTYSIINNNNINNNINNNHNQNTNQNINPNNAENNSNNCFYKFLIFIKLNLDFIFKNDTNINLPGIIFIKILRLLTETHIYHHVYKLNNYDNLNESNNNNSHINDIANSYQKIGFNDQTKKFISEIYDIQIYILTKIYQEKKHKIFEIGRELIRLLIPVGRSNIDIINTIFTDLLNNNYYEKILNIPYPEPGYNIYAQINIPPLMERMIIYILTKVKKSSSTYNYYLGWIFREFKIANCIGNTILIDLTRFVMTNYYFFFYKNNCVSDCVPRWLILCYILKHFTNHILSSELKQVLFMDLILFDKNRDNYKLVEPSILSIIINMKEYPEFSEELIEFLDSYVKHFDNNNAQKRINSVFEAFKMLELKDNNNNNLEIIIRESKMEEKYKNILINLIKNETVINSNNKKKNEERLNYNNGLAQNLNNIIKSKNEADINKNKNNFQNNKNDNNNINNFNEIFINPANNDILKQLDEKNRNKNQIDNKDKNNEQTSDKNEEISIEIIIPKEFNSYVKNSTLKNFLDEKNKKNFYNLLNDICNYNIKTFGKSNSVIKNLDSSYISLCKNFADFFIKVFKDELEFKDFEYLDFSQNKSDKNKKYIYTYLFDYAYEKNKDNQTFSFIADLINNISELYKPFILHLMSYVLYNTVNKNKNEKTYNGINFFYQINNKDIKMIKNKLNLFFTQCEENFLMYFLRDFFKYGGIELFHEAFFDDDTLIFKIIRNCDLSCINTIKMSLLNNNYILIDKIFLNLCRHSFLLSPSEKIIFWNLIVAQKCIPSVNLEDFLKFCIDFLNNPPTNNFKEESIKINNDEFFDKVIICIKNLFQKEIYGYIAKGSWDDLSKKFMYIFDFSQNLKKYIYQVIDSFLDIIIQNNDRKKLFYLMVQQYYKKNKGDINKLRGLVELLDYFLKVQTENNKNKNNKENNIGWFSEEINILIKDIIKCINQFSNS